MLDHFSFFADFREGGERPLCPSESTTEFDILELFFQSHDN